MNHIDNPRFSILLLLAACLIAWGWYGLTDLEGPDEARYVQVAKELQQRADWLNLTVFGEAYDQKPPLAFWMFAGMLKLTGGEISSWAVRFPSVLFGVLCVLMVYDIGRRRFDQRVGLLSAFVLLTAPLFMRQVPTARLDIFYTGWSVAAFWVLLTARPERLSWARAGAFWLCVAGAFFTKGPLVFVTVLGTLLAEAGLRRTLEPWRRIRPLPGLLALGLLIGGWLWSQHQAQGQAFVVGQVWTGTLGRVIEENHREAFWYYATALLGSAFAPWSLFLLAACVRLWRQRSEGLPTDVRLIGLWAALTLIVLQLSLSKRAQYLTIVLPPLSLLTGWFIATYLAGQRFVSFRTTRRIGSLGLVLSGALIVLGVVCLTFPEPLWAQRVYILEWQSLLIIAAGIAFTRLSLRAMRGRSTDSLLRFLALLLLIGGSTYFCVARTALDPRRSSRLFALSVDSSLPRDEPVIGALGKAENVEYHVYGHYRVQPLKAASETFATPTALPALLVGREKDLARYEAAAMRAGFVIEYRLPAAGEPMVLLRRPELASVSNAKRETPSLVFAIAGDTGSGDVHERQIVDGIMRIHERHPLDGVLLLGDNLYGSDPFPVAIESRFTRPFAPLLSARVPFYATLGNHDYSVADRAEGEMNFPPFNMKGRNYYSITLGDGLISFFFIDSEIVAQDQPQLAWLREAVLASRSTWKVLIAHIPMQASDISHGTSKSDYRALKEIITAPDGIDLVLTGHNHVYERRVPVDDVLHVTVGSSGKLDDDQRFEEDAGRVVGFNAERAFAWMQVYPHELRFRAVSQSGKVIDRFVYTRDRVIAPLEQP